MKIPYFYEGAIARGVQEPDGSYGARIEDEHIECPDLYRFRDLSLNMTAGEAVQWVKAHRDEFGADTLIASTDYPEIEIRNCPTVPKLILVLEPLNDVRHINTMLEEANRKMGDGGIVSMHCTTSGEKRRRILAAFPPVLNRIFYVFYYVWSRVFVKLSLTRPLYMFCTSGKGRNYPRVEIMGRVSRAGFTIVDDRVRHGEYYLSAVRTSEPITSDTPSYGPLIRLMRVGYQGKLIGVYKLRTMYAYSEYLQDYVYRRSGLRDGGKLKDDFRINCWGRVMRSVWMDELPMLVNWLKGDLKLVGVRPLSLHYYSLYTPGMQQLRIQVKPGLIPPFYYDRIPPKTVEDVQENERRYIEAYLRAPLKTDVRYFFGIIANILFRRERSH